MKTLFRFLIFPLILQLASCTSSPDKEAVSGSYTRQKASSSAPNIVLIIIDTLRADFLGSYSERTPSPSPELDALALRGTLFEKAFVQSSWTRSSHGSFLTSLYPRTLGIYKEQWDILRDEFITLAEILQSGGYHTVGFTANPNINTVFNFDQGFDSYSDSQVVFKWMPTEGEQEQAGGGTPLQAADDIFRQALAHVKSAPQKPTYLQINIMEVHRWRKVKSEHISPAFTSLPKADAQYSTTVEDASNKVGSFVEQLSALPGWDNTLFVITSDHGEGLDDHPTVHASRGHGNILYESQIAVPLIFYHPQNLIPAKRRISDMVTLLDLMPTLVEFAGLSVEHTIEGQSLLPLLQKTIDSNYPFPEFSYAEATWREVDKLAVFSSEWSFIWNRDSWPGVNEKELQELGVKANGKLSDKGESEFELAKDLKEMLNSWNARYIGIPASDPDAEPESPEIEQLRSLGYLQ